jgi:hypothetical protein
MVLAAAASVIAIQMTAGEKEREIEIDTQKNI